jgi:cytochrome b561
MIGIPAMKEKLTQFRTFAKWLHWLVVFFLFNTIVWSFSFKWQAPEDRATAIPAHVSIGMIVLALTLVRLAYRSVNPPPSIPLATPDWIKVGAHLGHFMLYALVIYMAIIGIWMAAISPVDIRVFSGLNLSAFGEPNAPLLAALRQWHFGGAILFVLTILGHIAGALWHHFLLKDDVLTRMLPFSGFVSRVLGQGKPAAWRFPSKNQVDWHRKPSWFSQEQE